MHQAGHMANQVIFKANENQFQAEGHVYTLWSHHLMQSLQSAHFKTSVYRWGYHYMVTDKTVG